MEFFAYLSQRNKIDMWNKEQIAPPYYDKKTIEAGLGAKVTFLSILRCFSNIP